MSYTLQRILNSFLIDTEKSRGPDKESVPVRINDANLISNR